MCRCEVVSEAEIVAACHAPVPACTYDALKRRVRVGSGRCQGSFDQPYVIDIMARELGVSPLEITKKGGRSRMVVRRTKEVGAWKHLRCDVLVIGRAAGLPRPMSAPYGCGQRHHRRAQ